MEFELLIQFKCCIADSLAVILHVDTPALPGRLPDLVRSTDRFERFTVPDRSECGVSRYTCRGIIQSDKCS
jgi:hypothetical protein